MPEAVDSISKRFLRRHWTFVAVLLIGAAFVALVGNGRFPLVDRDEPLYAQSSRQMLQSGDWTTPKYLDTLRLKKPVGIYWLQAASMHAFGDTPFAARLPSALATVGTLALLSVALPPIVGHRRAFWAAFILATAVLPAYLSKVGMTDAVLNLTITAGMLCLYAIWRGRARWPTVVALGVAIGASLLAKGPPILLFLGMTLVALWVINATLDDRDPARRTVDLQRLIPAATMKVAAVAAIALLICLPWVRALERAHPGALLSMFQKEIVARGTVPQEGHSGPPGYYFATFWGTYFPWCLIWPAALVEAWRRRHVAWVRFSLAAVLGPWAFLELYRTKLPHYWLPSYPFMAILTADVLLRVAGARIVAMRDRTFIIAATAVAVIVSLAAGVPLALAFLGGFEARVWPGVLAAIVLWIGVGALAVAAVRRFEQRRMLAAAGVMGVGFWAVLASAFAVYWPATPSLTLARRIGTALRAEMAAKPGEAMMIGFKEPSLAFYQGGTIREQRDGLFVDHVTPDRWPRWLVIEEEQWRLNRASADPRWATVRSFSGLNLAAGRLTPRTVLLLENRRTPATLPGPAVP